MTKDERPLTEAAVIAGAGAAAPVVRALLALADAGGECLMVADRQGRIVFSNSSACARLGVEAHSDVLSLSDLVSARTAAELTPSGAWQGAVQMTHRKSGAPVDLLGRAVSLTDADGNPDGHVYVLRAPDPEEAAESAVARVARRTQLVQRAANFTFYEVNLATGLVERDGWVQQVLGYHPAELGTDRQGWLEIIHPDDAEAVDRAYAAAVAGLDSLRIDYRVRNKAGDWVWVNDIALVARDASGVARHITGCVTDVSSRKASEAALEESTMLAAGVSEVAPSILYIYDLERTRNVWGNREITRVLGYSRAELDAIEGNLMQALIHPDDWPGYQQHLARIDALADGERARFDYRMRRNDGGWVWLSSIDMVFRRNAAGKPSQIVGSALDITAARAMQHDLAESRRAIERSLRELELVYARAPLGLALIDTDLRIVRINQALAEINGFAVEEHIGRHVWDMVPDLREGIEPILRRVIETGEAQLDVPIVGETPAQPGLIREWREQFYPITDDDGAVIGIGVVCEEMTERLRLEAEVRESEQHLRNLLDQLFVFAGTLTPEGTVIQANNAPLEAAGIQPADVVGRVFAEAACWSFDAGVQARMRESIRRAGAGETVRYDTEMQLPGGRRMTIDLQIGPLRDGEGRITHLVVSAIPIDDRLAVQAELEAINQQLERRVEDEVRRREAAQAAMYQAQKLEALGQLTAGIAHDFNNVVAALAGGFALVRQWTNQDRVREVAQHGAEAALRGGELVKQLLAFARQQALEPRTVALPPLLREVEPLLHRTLGEGIALRVDCEPDVCFVRVDPIQLETALINLAVNARDAMPDGGQLTISAMVVETVGPASTEGPGEGRFVAIEVADTGIGMSPGVIERAREPFFTTKGPGKGTGLGLAMIHGFAQQSGGALRIASREGGGTQVTIYLPCVDEPDDDTAGREAPATRPPVAVDATILLVDDDPLVRRITALQLREMGYVVIEAEDAAGAMRQLADHPRIDLVLTDVVMPGEDGVTLAAQVRALRTGVRVGFMTGHADRERLAGEAVIDKPFREADLGEFVRGLLEGGSDSNQAGSEKL